jgi:hypothetical protein
MSALEGKADMPRRPLLAKANPGKKLKKVEHLRGRKVGSSYHPAENALKFAGIRRTARREFVLQFHSLRQPSTSLWSVPAASGEKQAFNIMVKPLQTAAIFIEKMR